MTTMIFISSVAMLVGIVGSFVIWRMDASRAEEIEHETARARRPAAPSTPARRRKEIGPQLTRTHGRTRRRSASCAIGA